MKARSIKALIACSCIVLLVGCGHKNEITNSISKQENVKNQQTNGSSNSSQKNKLDKQIITEDKQVDKQNEEKEIKEEINVNVNKEDDIKEEKDTTENKENQEKKSQIGTIAEKKDFMFILEDEEKKPYAFAFDKKPEEYDQLVVGDYIEVEYTGKLSEIEAFKGEILSIKIVKKEDENN